MTWHRWKLIHKETGLTFKQKARPENGGINYYINKSKSDSITNQSSSDDITMIPVLLTHGYPAVYFDEDYYPSMSFLVAKEWIVKMKETNKIESGE